MSSRQERSEYDTLLFPRNILANEIAAMKHRCCSSEDADVAKINFMYFNPGVSNQLKYDRAVSALDLCWWSK
jgi:hypothetical protein